MANIGQGQMQKPVAMGAGAGVAKIGMANEPKKSKKWLWWTIGILALLIIVGLIWWLMS